jgi:hypothetical protein
MLRRAAPWVISIAALVFVFGRTDVDALLKATQGANLPLFIAIVVADKLVFFLAWAFVCAEAVRRFVVPVPRGEVVSVRGGSELFRVVNNPLADLAFAVGVGRLTGGKLEAVFAALLVPGLTHLVVLLAQASLALPLLGGGVEQNRDVLATVIMGWGMVALIAILLRSPWMRRWPMAGDMVGWLDGVNVRALLPFFAWFAALAAFDVLIQGIASLAFGVAIPWTALVARIPIVYIALSLPSVGNFGVRETVWAALFAEYGSHDALIAYAFATNAIFMVMHLLIGLAFVRRAFDLAAEVRRTARTQPLQEPLLRDAIDP